MKIIRIGSVELTSEEAQRFFDEGRYIVSRSRVYKIIRRGNTFHGKTVYTGERLCLKGRFHALTPEVAATIFPL